MADQGRGLQATFKTSPPTESHVRTIIRRAAADLDGTVQADEAIAAAFTFSDVNYDEYLDTLRRLRAARTASPKGTLP